MASLVQVANRALSKIGAARIISLTDDNKQARAVNSCIYDIIDDELRAHRWQFSLKRTSVAALSDAPAFGYQHQYAMPPDFLRIDMVNDEYPAAVMDNYIGAEYLDWILEGGVILTNFASPLKIRYVASMQDPSTWDSNFREAIASRIAMEIAEELTQSNEKKQFAQTDYRRALSQAIRTGAIERPPVMPPDDQWVVSRL